MIAPFWPTSLVGYFIGRMTIGGGENALAVCLADMVIERKQPRYPRRGPSCLFVLFIMLGIAMSLYVIVRPDTARDVIEEIIPTPTPEPTRSAAEYALLADLSERDGEYEQAVDFYKQAISLDATKPEFFVRLINLLVLTGQPELALEAADQATVLAPDSDAVWTAVAAAHLANGDRLDNLGDKTGADLQYTQAAQAADKATDLNPNSATAFAYKAGGLVLQEDPDLYELAQEMADTAVFLEPDNPIARLYMAKVFDYQGFYTAAREQYQLGIQSNPSLVDLHIGLAYNYFGTSNIPEAILSFEEAIAVDPDNAIAYDGLAYMYLQLGEDALAEEKAVTAVKLDPNVARAHGRLGEAYFRRSNYAEAIKELELAVQMYGEPTSLNARFFNLLATAYYFMDPALCPQAVPLFEQVLTVAVPESLVEIRASEGLELCRQAALESTP